MLVFVLGLLVVVVVVCMYTCVYASMCVYKYVCVHVCVCMYVHVRVVLTPKTLQRSVYSYFNVSIHRKNDTIYPKKISRAASPSTVSLKT